MMRFEACDLGLSLDLRDFKIRFDEVWIWMILATGFVFCVDVGIRMFLIIF